MAGVSEQVPKEATQCRADGHRRNEVAGGDRDPKDKNGRAKVYGKEAGDGGAGDVILGGLRFRLSLKVTEMIWERVRARVKDLLVAALEQVLYDALLRG